MRDKENLSRWKKNKSHFDFSRCCTLQRGQKEIFHVSAHCRKAKKKFFMLLHTAERPKRRFSCFCTLQKGQKEVFQASAHCRKAKKKFFVLLHTAERLKRSFSCFCTLKKDKKLIFHASAHCRKTKKKYYKKESIKIQLSLT